MDSYVSRPGLTPWTAEEVKAEQEKRLAGCLKLLDEAVREAEAGVPPPNLNVPTMSELLHIDPAVAKKEVAIEDLMAAHDRAHNELFTVPSFVTETSNRERELPAFLREHLPEIITRLPMRTSLFDFTDAQLLAIAQLTTPFDRESFTQLEITSEAMRENNRNVRGGPTRGRVEGFFKRYSVEKGAIPLWNLLSYCVGSGKTAIATTALLLNLVDPVRWKAISDAYPKTLHMRTCHADSGLLKGKATEHPRLARAAVIIVPEGMLHHWKKFLDSCLFGIRETFQSNVQVNVWTHFSARQNMLGAYSDGQPTVILTTLTAASTKEIQKHPDIGVVARLYDELNASIGVRNKHDEPPFAFNYITQATIQSLSRATSGAPSHPFRLALGGHNLSAITEATHQFRGRSFQALEQTLDHFCKIRQFSVPQFLRKLVAKDAVHHMPRGVVVYNVPFRPSTLAGYLNRGELVTIPLTTLVQTMLGSHNADATTVAAILEILNKAKTDTIGDTLDEFKAHVATLPEESLPQRESKMAVKRVYDRLHSVFRNEVLPDCPVLMEPLTPMTARLLPCCTGLLSKEAFDLCKRNQNLCPLCRAPLLAAAELPTNATTSEAAASSNADGKRPREEPPEAPTTLEGFAAKCKAAPMTSVDTVLKMLDHHISTTPHARILLAADFGIGGISGASLLVEKAREQLPSAVVYKVPENRASGLSASVSEMISNYQTPTAHPQPHVLILNATEHGNSTVMGYDLGMTTLVVATAAITGHMLQQFIGRVFRMRVRTGLAPDERLPPVAMALLRRAATARPARGEDSSEDSDSDEPDAFEQLQDHVEAATRHQREAEDRNRALRQANAPAAERAQALLELRNAQRDLNAAYNAQNRFIAEEAREQALQRANNPLAEPLVLGAVGERALPDDSDDELDEVE